MMRPSGVGDAREYFNTSIWMEQNIYALSDSSFSEQTAAASWRCESVRGAHSAGRGAADIQVKKDAPIRIEIGRCNEQVREKARACRSKHRVQSISGVCFALNCPQYWGIVWAAFGCDFMSVSRKQVHSLCMPVSSQHTKTVKFGMKMTMPRVCTSPCGYQLYPHTRIVVIRDTSKSSNRKSIDRRC
jgi:hypothetical protein